MGANGVIDIIKGSTIEKAYRSAIQYAAAEYGSSYSGEINMGNGFRLASVRPEGMTSAESDALLNAAKKWGPSVCAPVLDEKTLAKAAPKTLVKFYESEIAATEALGAIFSQLAREGRAAVKWTVTCEVASKKAPKRTKGETFFKVNGARFNSRQEATDHAKTLATKGYRVSLEEITPIVFEPSGEILYKLTVEHSRILKSTKAIKGSWWAAGWYSC